MASLWDGVYIAIEAWACVSADYKDLDVGWRVALVLARLQPQTATSSSFTLFDQNTRLCLCSYENGVVSNLNDAGVMLTDCCQMHYTRLILLLSLPHYQSHSLVRTG